MIPVLVLHGPNLNLVGKREPQVYGRMNLHEINQKLVDLGRELGLEVHVKQSNSEGALIDAIQEVLPWAKGIVINAGGYSHTSVSIRDAIASTGLPVIEVHLSNIFARDEFRHHSMLTPVCRGCIVGLGWRSYTLGLRYLAEVLTESS